MKRAALKPIAAVVFDCDGVLIESVDVKADAFVEVFSDFPQHAEAIRTHHQEHLGLSRFRKFQWVYDQLLKRELTRAESTSLGRKFSSIVLEGVRSCPEVEGTQAALETIAAHLPCFIASGIPELELQEIILNRGWTQFFDGIHGSPTLKPEILCSIASSLSCELDELLFVGDGFSDYSAAQETGAQFVWRRTTAQQGWFEDYEGHSIEDLRKLPELALRARST